MAVRPLRADERPAPPPLAPPVDRIVRERHIRFDIKCTPATPSVGEPMSFLARATDLETCSSTSGGPEELRFTVVDPRGIMSTVGPDYAPSVPGMHTIAVEIDGAGAYTKFYALPRA